MDELELLLNQPESSAAAPRILRVLVADDSENDVVILLHGLRKAGYAPQHRRVSAAAAMRAALQEQSWDIVISDYEMPGFGGFEALQVLKESGQDLPFILVSAVVSEETAVAAMKAGAHDFIMKSKLARLWPAIERELREAHTRAAKKSAEDALRKSEDQLRQAQKLEAVARLAAGVAHDFNNILTAIGGHGEMLLARLEEADPKRKNVEQIAQCANMAAGLTRQLLTFSRKQVIEPRVLQLNEVIQNLQKMLRRLIGEDLEFNVDLDPAVGHIKADPGQMEQVIMNLVVNARDAMPHGGKLVVKTACDILKNGRLKAMTGFQPGPCVLLSVSDTGTGMSEEVKAHLFEPFFTTKPAGKGTGLGLATCFGIIKQSSGHIEVESELGKGTTFKLYFPQVQEAVEPVRTGGAARLAIGGTETVLVVEDDAAVRGLVVYALRERGYTVIEAADGGEGLRIARQHNGEIHLAFTDIVMPALGGKAMADELASFRPDTKVLYTSGYTEDTIGHHGVLKPGIAFLQKPYFMATLASRVRDVLDEHAE